MTETIIINKELHLSPPLRKNSSVLVGYLNDRVIYDGTLRIPFPYTENDAASFFDRCEKNRSEFKRQMNWSILNEKDEPLGGISFHGYYPHQPHREEVGYWLARPFHNKGIMSAVLKGFCEYGFNECGYSRIEAPIFDFNISSQRVVEKCGFVCEGILKKAYFKDGKFIDGKMYALVK